MTQHTRKRGAYRGNYKEWGVRIPEPGCPRLVLPYQVLRRQCVVAPLITWRNPISNSTKTAREVHESLCRKGNLPYSTVSIRHSGKHR